ncbi:MAG TPA: glycosyltransferase family 39 protein [Acidobacteriaceae bacterium]|nr:glycosyltransferase family 39 protein [Acidobacteriaceae bacterium]
MNARTSGPITDRIAELPSWLLWFLLFVCVALAHLTLLRLPYYWDEGGYYIPAALDFYHHGWIIPQFTNAHPPLPNILLGTLWHIVGLHILATRLAVCAVAAAALTAIFRLAQRLLDSPAAISLTLMIAVYPIWFAQSTLAHADIFAAAFTVWAFAVYLPATSSQLPTGTEHNQRRNRIAVAVLFSLAALSKETAIVEPAALIAIEAGRFIDQRRSPTERCERVRWIAALAVPFLPLIAWYAYHRARTGFIFGNPVYLRYNATANFTAAHILTSLRYRFLHLVWQRNIWLPILLAVACLLLSSRPRNQVQPLTTTTRLTCALLILANWIAFSVLGGALLTRYLLPVYPIILLLCVDTWRERTAWLPWLTAATAAMFLTGLWINPPTAFAPEDTLVYRDMIVVHQEAIAFLNQHYPDATVLTAWPVSNDLANPELGYTSRRIRVTPVEDFSLAEIQKAAEHPENFDTAIVFTTHYVAPSLQRYILSHPASRIGRAFTTNPDLSPSEIAALLHGQIVWRSPDLDGEWAVVLRFNRSYEAKAAQPDSQLSALASSGLVPQKR